MTKKVKTRKVIKKCLENDNKDRKRKKKNTCTQRKYKERVELLQLRKDLEAIFTLPNTPMNQNKDLVTEFKPLEFKEEDLTTTTKETRTNKMEFEEEREEELEKERFNMPKLLNHHVCSICKVSHIHSLLGTCKECNKKETYNRDDNEEKMTRNLHCLLCHTFKHRHRDIILHTFIPLESSSIVTNNDEMKSNSYFLPFEFQLAFSDPQILLEESKRNKNSMQSLNIDKVNKLKLKDGQIQKEMKEKLHSSSSLFNSSPNSNHEFSSEDDDSGFEDHFDSSRMSHGNLSSKSSLVVVGSSSSSPLSSNSSLKSYSTVTLHETTSLPIQMTTLSSIENEANKKTTLVTSFISNISKLSSFMQSKQKVHTSSNSLLSNQVTHKNLIDSNNPADDIIASNETSKVNKKKPSIKKWFGFG